MSWFLYIIECMDGSLYTGITVDVGSRYAAHVSGKGARYTRSHPPRRLMKTIEFKDRSAAAKAEYAIKRLTADEKRKFAICEENLTMDLGKRLREVDISSFLQLY